MSNHVELLTLRPRPSHQQKLSTASLGWSNVKLLHVQALALPLLDLGFTNMKLYEYAISYFPDIVTVGERQKQWSHYPVILRQRTQFLNQFIFCKIVTISYLLQYINCQLVTITEKHCIRQVEQL